MTRIQRWCEAHGSGYHAPQRCEANWYEACFCTVHVSPNVQPDIADASLTSGAEASFGRNVADETEAGGHLKLASSETVSHDLGTLNVSFVERPAQTKL